MSDRRRASRVKQSQRKKRACKKCCTQKNIWKGENWNKFIIESEASLETLNPPVFAIFKFEKKTLNQIYYSKKPATCFLESQQI